MALLPGTPGKSSPSAPASPRVGSPVLLVSLRSAHGAERGHPALRSFQISMFRDRPPERRELLCPKFKCLGRKLIGAMCPGVHSRCNQLWLGLGSLQPVPQSVGAPGKVAGAPRSGLERASVSQHTAQHLPGASTSALSSEAASEGNSSSSECLQKRRVDIYPVEVKSSVCDISQYTPSGWHRLLIGFPVRSTLAIESVGEGALRGPGLPGWDVHREAGRTEQALPCTPVAGRREVPSPPWVPTTCAFALWAPVGTWEVEVCSQVSVSPHDTAELLRRPPCLGSLLP